MHLEKGGITVIGDIKHKVDLKWIHGGSRRSCVTLMVPELGHIWMSGGLCHHDPELQIFPSLPSQGKRVLLPVSSVCCLPFLGPLVPKGQIRAECSLETPWSHVSGSRESRGPERELDFHRPHHGKPRWS